ncbi:MAG TPA: immunoglobulin domain-containing protein [Verrucomicrobiae bacterium]|nr:immunoglobulin domain-containing protein [Verrucomicrobiae bacterium]
MQAVTPRRAKKRRRVRNEFCCWASALTVFLATLICVRAADFYVSPTGSASGNGSIGNPWDLLTAFGQPSSVQPGDTIWFRGGIYVPANPSWPSLECYLQGTANAPIIVRAYPGERVIFQENPNYNNSYDQNVLYQASGGYVWFWGIEVRSTNSTHATNVTGSDPTHSQLPIPGGVQISAPGVRLINMIIHDTRGSSMYAGAVNAEAYGCLIYNNGWTAPDRGHGHGLYIQNLNGVMHLSDNIIFNQFGLGIHGYTQDSSLKHFLVERNVVFNNSRIGEYPDGPKEQILFGGGPPIQDLKLFNNYLYLPLGISGTLMRLDYAAISNDDVTVANNYLAGDTADAGVPYAVSAQQYQSVVFTNNTVYSSNGGMLQLNSKSGDNVNHNAYYGDSNANFNNNGGQYNFAGWKSATGFDANSTYSVNTAPADQVFVLPNAYESKRANIVVYNWSNANNVSVDVSSVLSPGDTYEVHNAQDYFAAPVLSGTYNGSPLSLPITNLTVAVPGGWTDLAAVPTTGKQFNVFVLLGATGGTSAVPPQITQQPANQAVLSGQPATFTVSASGTPPLNYQWQRNSSKIASATSTSYTVSSPTSADSGATFRCTVSNAYGVATSDAATLTVINPSDPPVITAGPTATNALLQVGNLAVVDASSLVWLRVDAAGASALTYQWNFGDGSSTSALNTNITSHDYDVPTNCSPYVASVTVSDGTHSTSTNLRVAVAYQLNVTKLNATLKFAKLRGDSCNLSATFAACSGFDVTNKAVVVNVGDAQVSFRLNKKGRGRTGRNTCRIAYNKVTGLGTFTAQLKDGAWQGGWEAHGLCNTTVRKPGIGATLPVALLVGDEGFAAETQLLYTATAGRSGVARLTRNR